MTYERMPMTWDPGYKDWMSARADERAAKLAAQPVPDDLVPLALVPVQVFGATCDCHDHLEGTEQGEKCRGWGYGLSDAVSSWSDCNRAEGHIYRVDDTDPDYREHGDTQTVYASRAAMPWFEKRFDAPEEGDPETREVTEYAVVMSGGSMQVRPNDPEIDRIYPLADWISHMTQNGGKVCRRVVRVVSDWEEVNGP